METINPGMSACWSITLTFPTYLERRIFSSDRMNESVWMHARDPAWRGRHDKPSLPQFQVRSYCPYTDVTKKLSVVMDHRDATLTHKQLYAYERWVGDIAHRVLGDAKARLCSVGFEDGAPFCDDVTCEVGILYSAGQMYPDGKLIMSSEPYRIRAAVNDMVRMRNGTLAVVVKEDYLCGGNCKLLTLRPICGIFRHMWLLLTQRLTPADHQIDKLVKVGEVPIA